MIRVNGMTTDVVPATDRGLAYGDGVFRTLAVRNGRAVQWTRQYAKLQADCARLGIACPDARTLHQDVMAVASAQAHAAVKIIVTRGPGERGYRLPTHARPSRIVIGSPLPVYPPAHLVDGVDVHLCRTRLGAQPALAGVKHLNRLENVLARAEWNTDDFAEGLMADETGHVVCGTMTNVFVVEDGELHTPDLARCGVAGVTRELILERAAAGRVQCRTTNLSLERLLEAEEVFLANSLIGVWRVRSIAGQTIRERGMTQQVRGWLDESGAGD